MRPLPTIPAKAGIRKALIRIPAFAGMVGRLRSGGNGKSKMMLNRPLLIETFYQQRAMNLAAGRR